jgi:hypothetical protein
MTFKFSFRVDPEAMTVPYAPITDDIRRNRGFTDLRRRPDQVNKIAEGNESAALRRLLVRVAAVGSPIFTIGCDLGAHREPANVPVRRREVAGGYIVAHVKGRTREDNWRIDFIGRSVNFQFESEHKGIYPSLWIWFFAAAREPVAALQSRERLIEAIDEATALPATLQSFASA